MTTMFNVLSTLSLAAVACLILGILVDSLFRAILGPVVQVRRARLGRWARYYPNASRPRETHGRPMPCLTTGERIALYVLAADGLHDGNADDAQRAINEHIVAMAKQTLGSPASQTRRTKWP